jgi:hypothetical protein
MFGLRGAVAYAEESSTPREESSLSSAFPSQEADAVREVVGASHARFDRVKEMVTKRPALAKAAWDWGFGDWESALGAASHMGRKDIATFLMAHGARPDIFTFAMLGELAAVRGMVEAIPGIQRTPGPHGITLLQHARNRLSRDDGGAEDAKKVRAVVAYLESLGDADECEPALAISDEEKSVYLGRFEFGPAAEVVFVVDLNRRGDLSFRRGEQTTRRLNMTGQHSFAPAGAPAVRILFDVRDGQAVAVTVHDPDPIVRAKRVASGT